MVMPGIGLRTFLLDLLMGLLLWMIHSYDTGGIKNISFIILQNLGHLREKKGNLFQTSRRDLIRCIKIFPLKLNLQKPLPR
jgi:hypothetical protein